jgi:hypothetical protein
MQTGFFVCAKTTKRAEDFLLTAVTCYFRLSLPDFSPKLELEWKESVIFLDAHTSGQGADKASITLLRERERERTGAIRDMTSALLAVSDRH